MATKCNVNMNGILVILLYNHVDTSMIVAFVPKMRDAASYGALIAEHA